MSHHRARGRLILDVQINVHHPPTPTLACHPLKTSRRIQNKCSLIAVLGGKELAILRGT
ncbi:hypothetical protein AVEN_238895-1, partial [Araneus ventricosus]